MPRHHRHLTAAERRRISKRERGRHLSAATRRKISAREKGRHHKHRGYHGHRHERHHRVHRKAVRHKVRHGHRRVAGIKSRRPRRERIYPSHFKHGRTRLHSRFYRGKRIHHMRDPFKAGRRHLRHWR